MKQAFACSKSKLESSTLLWDNRRIQLLRHSHLKKTWFARCRERRINPLQKTMQTHYPRPVLAFGYCHRLRLWVCVSVCVCVHQSRACPDDNSSPIQARITKFRPEMQNTLVWVPIVFGDDRPWSSRSNLTWKSNFTSFWTCSHHYSSALQSRITKFGPKMHLSTDKISINFGLD